MTFTRTQSVLILTLCAAFLVFSLLNASWTAAAPMGGPKLISNGGAGLPVDARGCIVDPQTGYGASLPPVDVRMLQAAAGLGAAAVNVPIDASDTGVVIGRTYNSTCAADNARPRAALAKAPPALSNAEMFVRLDSAAQVSSVLSAIPASSKAVYYGNDAAIQAVKKARPGAVTYTLAAAQACTLQYRQSGWTGIIPASCKGGAAIVTMDQIGYTLWGWPNRFLARMNDGGVRVIIAQDIKDGKITGLTTADQYGEIASSYNGYIWIDDIAELGPALKR